MEDVNRQIKERKKPEEDKGIARVRSANSRQRYIPHQQKPSQQETQKCKNCGYVHQRNRCPAHEKKCNKWNHFSAVCLSKPEKCQFGKETLELYGYKFSKDGLMPTDEKVSAIKECTRPESKTEVRSVLDMTGYLQKFIPRYASLTKPLRDLTLKDNKFHCYDKEENAFQALKDSISSSDTMAFFNTKFPIMVRTEAVSMKVYQQDYFKRERKEGNQSIS